MAPILFQEKIFIRKLKNFFFLNGNENSIFPEKYFFNIQNITKKINKNEVKIDKTILRRQFSIPLIFDSRPTFGVKLGKRYI
jgi:hypothetical protein